MHKIHIILDRQAPPALCALAVELSQAVALFSDVVCFPPVLDAPDKDSVNVILVQGQPSVDKVAAGYEVRVGPDESVRDAFVRVMRSVFEVDVAPADVGGAKDPADADGPLPDALTDDLGMNPTDAQPVNVSALFGEGRFKKRDTNRVFQGQRLAVARPEKLDFEQAQLLSALVARIAMDSESLVFPALTADRAALRLMAADETCLTAYEGALVVRFDPARPDDLYRLLETPDVLPFEAYMAKAVGLKNLDGQMAYALNQAQPGDRFYLEKVDSERLDSLSAILPFSLHSYKDERLVFEDRHQFTWEVTRLKALVASRLDSLAGQEALIIEACVSEDLPQRLALKEDIAALLADKGLSADIRVYNAHKQGFSWLTEQVAEAASERSVSSITVRFSEFVKTPGEAWTAEAGAVPSFVNANLNNTGKWFDMPIRLLQELYPADDLLSDKLQMPRDNISFELIRDCDNPRYEAELVFEDGKRALFDFEPVFSERPYLDDFPAMGLVHPGTGYLRVRAGGETIVFDRQPTDLEMIWDYYQQTILPRAASFADSFRQPLFSTLFMDISVSEADDVLPCRQDLLSAMDSFHEDLYFAGLDYFRLIGQTRFDTPLDAPGLILPVIHQRAGDPEVTWRISLPLDQAPFYERDGLKTPLPQAAKACPLTKLCYDNGARVAQFDGQDADPAQLSHLKDLIERGLSDLPDEAEAFDRLVITGRDDSLTIAVPKRDRTADLSDFSYQRDELYGEQANVEAIKQLQNTKGLTVTRLCRSYEGRPLHMVSFEDKGFTTSYKRTNSRPTVFIKARHHANEVSSSNSTFHLVKLLGTDPRYEEAREKLNIVFLPCQNPDGVALHETLQQEHPFWIFHISRFNALGREIGNEFFKPGTIHTEAKAMHLVYDRWLPDIYVDDHGVPSHEWCQPFSGYTAPAFKGFWLPRSLLYGYFWYPQGEAYAGQQALARELQDAIAERINRTEAFVNINRDMKDRFLKYANLWLPKMFPADYYRELIFYWIPIAVDPGHRYLSIRYPDITTVSYTSEVADETAQGSYLGLCADAHVENDLAIIEHMSNRQYGFLRVMTIRPDEILIVNRRNRK